MEETSYTIEGREFVQKPLVWGQVRQLLAVLKGVDLTEAVSPMDIISLIGDKMPDALAVVLTEKGGSVKDKDLTSLSEFLGFHIPVKMMVMVIEDFFECNPTAIYLEKIEKLIGKIEVPGQISSLAKLSSSLAEETSPSET